jgi:ABC-2 type transport system permease protein
MKPSLKPQGPWPSLRREARFVARERTVWAAWLVVLLLSMLAVMAGLREVGQQQATIARLLEADRSDRQAVLQAQKDWGGAAYYSFHLTFDAPSDFAFAALGRRDDTAWKHRVRMLALEGQIHERDAGHPVLALIGRFDFAFFAAFVLPLVLIVQLYDLRSSERVAGRHDLLVATAGHARALWRWRAGLRAAGVWLCAVLPLLAAGAFSGTALATLAAACAALAAYVVFWSLVCAALSAWRQPGEVILAVLVAVWILLGVVLPAAGRLVIDRAVPLPSGAQIIMTQREAVNDAWDLPKATTMSAFVARHPQWAAFSAVERPFEWKWYYAFQQVGDQKAEALSAAYKAGRLERDRLASRIARIAPPVLLERALQTLAHTDLRANLGYEARVREFHAALREFYYPRLFRNEPFDPAALQGLPRFHGVSAEAAQSVATVGEHKRPDAGKKVWEAQEARD